MNICAFIMLKLSTVLGYRLANIMIKDMVLSFFMLNGIIHACCTTTVSTRCSMLWALCRSLSSKVVSQYSSIFAPMAVDAVLHILDQKRSDLLDLKDIRVVSKVGGTIDDSELVDGMIFSQKACKAAGGPTRIEKAKIGLIQVPHRLLMFRHSNYSNTL
jgi:hypothetical protein